MTTATHPIETQVGASSQADANLTTTQRVAQATKRVAEFLHVSDQKRVEAAITEIMVEEMLRNPGFALRVKGRYDELAPQKKPRSAQTREPKKVKITPLDLTPIRHIEGREIDITKPIDPYFLFEVYGAAQLPKALGYQTLPNLREALEIVQERHPGTKPKGRLTKETAIAYIVAYVTGAAN